MTTQGLKPSQDLAPTLPDEAAEAYGPIALRLPSAWRLTDALVEELCGLNPDIRLEINADGELELMPPAFSITGYWNAGITADLGVWTRMDGRGVAFGSTAGFTLSNRALRSPDASWILKSRLAELTADQKRGFARICPDFVIELRSESDRLVTLQRKMEEYIANGARLGWLIDPRQRRVYVYRPQTPVEILDGPQSLSGEPELPGFTLDLNPVWTPDY